MGSNPNPQWRPPSAPPPAILAEAREALAAFDRYLAPGPAEAVIAEVSVTLAMCNDREFDPLLGPAMIEAWAEDLGDLPHWAVRNACGLWRRSEKWRPTVAEIRQFARREIGDASETRRRLKLTVDAAAGEPERAA